MHYIEPIIRPPSEADSLLLQVTTGCSHNRCSFCAAYPAKPFTIKDDALLDEDIEFAARYGGSYQRIFLCDGDVLTIPHERLMRLLERIRTRLPHIGRIATYGSAKSAFTKTDAQLQALHRAGLKVVHLGLESGDDETLARVHKYGDSAFIIEQARRIQAAGMKLFVTVLLGLGGVERWAQHGRATGEALSAINPRYVGALSLMVIEGTELWEQQRQGLFCMPTPRQLLEELRIMVEYTEVSLSLFFANHASNYLPLRCRLPREKQQVLAHIDAALAGAVTLRPEWQRGL
jgi:radical SAM superfamily enzyme YgiQ (UPF0313 family)